MGLAAEENRRPCLEAFLVQCGEVGSLESGGSGRARKWLFHPTYLQRVTAPATSSLT